MKRSERFQARARRAALWAVAILSGTLCGGVWAVAAIDPLPSGGMLAAAVAMAGLWASGALARECAWLTRQAGREARWEQERETRPRP
jgi:hypothetical protein